MKRSPHSCRSAFGAHVSHAIGLSSGKALEESWFSQRPTTGCRRSRVPAPMVRSTTIIWIALAILGFNLTQTILLCVFRVLYAHRMLVVGHPVTCVRKDTICQTTSTHRQITVRFVLMERNVRGTRRWPRFSFCRVTGACLASRLASINAASLKIWRPVVALLRELMAILLALLAMQGLCAKSVSTKTDIFKMASARFVQLEALNSRLQPWCAVW
mmetsp:Transcript_29524/g.71762  ORF Transcript_29524/g.71762 Transcript_29524/m.71762 type:complete len:215 (+) Transcript_29524:3573-4217(+)